jgi:hypothetical protein
MADLSDVINVLADLASAALYPNGLAQPSVADITVTVVPGWPIPAQLDAIIKAGNAMVSVYQMTGMGKNTKRFLGDDDSQNAIPAAQLTLSVYTNIVTVGGSINPGEAATLRVNYQPYSYAVQETDTIETVAAALAALIPGASASGYLISINGAFEIETAISVPVVMQQEIGRQTQIYMITTWSPSPAARDTITKAIDLSFKKQPRIVMPDDTWARLLYHGTIEQDTLQKQRIYRRNLLYEVEYATMATETDHTVTNFGVTVTPANGTPRTTNI